MGSPLVETTAVVCGKERVFRLTNRALAKLQLLRPGEPLADFLKRAFDTTDINLTANVIAVSTEGLSVDDVLDGMGLGEMFELAARIVTRSLGLGESQPPLAETPESVNS